MDPLDALDAIEAIRFLLDEPGYPDDERLARIREEVDRS